MEITKEQALEIKNALATLQKYGMEIGQRNIGLRSPLYSILIPKTHLTFIKHDGKLLLTIE